MLDRLLALDMANMPMADMGQCAFVLKTLADVNETSTSDALLETMRQVCSGVNTLSTPPAEAFALGYMNGGGLHE